MAEPLTINLTQPVKSAKILDTDEHGGNTDEHGRQCQSVLSQRQSVSQLCQTLNGLVGELNRFYEQVLTKHKEEIAKLSVEIARKVLMQKVQKSDYQIESIVKEALKNAPTRQQVLVHLNPQDLSACQKLQQNDPGSAFAGIKFIADPSIGRAECLLETPKGIIKSFIEQHLERISEALTKVE
ncbi:MAG: FliH/SctL family protein [Sedimentisphaerales bacterium]